MFLSAKFLEKTYPGVNKLNSIIQSPFTYEDFITMEKHILETLRWDLYLVTPYDIFQHFLSQGVVFTTDKIQSKTAQTSSPTLQTVANVQKFAEFFLEMCLQEYSFHQYDQFTLACGVILAARKMIKVQDKWPH